MPKNICIKIILLLFIVTINNNAIAQAKPAKPYKFKPPVVKTYLGKIRGIKDSITVIEGQQLIDSSLKVLDAKGNIYAVTSYEFGFKRVGFTEDDSTGKVSPESDLAADHFITSPLPDLWRNTIKETLTKGEEFHFFDIVAADGKGNVFYAPEIRIGIK